MLWNVDFLCVTTWIQHHFPAQKSWTIIGLIIGLCGSTVVLALIRAKAFFLLTVRASKILHDRMTKAVLRAKIDFFDTNPMGRILNRFSADVGSNDDLLPQTLFDFLFILFIVLGGVVTACTALPVLLVVFPPLMWFFVSVRGVFVTSTRELKRLEGLARSPIFAMLSEALSGVATIRANNRLQFFQTKFEAIHDAHTRAFFPFIGSSRWFGFRMDAIVYIFLVFACFFSVLFHTQGKLSKNILFEGCYFQLKHLVVFSLSIQDGSRSILLSLVWLSQCLCSYLASSSGVSASQPRW